MFISAVLVREEAAPLTPTVAVISPVRTALVVNLLQLKVKRRDIVLNSMFGSLLILLIFNIQL